MTYSPIVLFVYNRISSVRDVVQSLLKNKEASYSDLFVYSDGGKNNEDWERVKEIRGFIKGVSGFKSVTIIERDKNIGLANSIIAGVSEIVEKFGKVIVVEDDLIVSSYFLKYMNDGLNLYKEDDRVGSINAFFYGVSEDLPESFFLRLPDSWGWGTWKNRWKLFEPDAKKLFDEIQNKNLKREFDFDGLYPYSQMLRGQMIGLTDSWAIRWSASLFLRKKLNVYPRAPLVVHIGGESSGTHNKHDMFCVSLCEDNIVVNRSGSVVENVQAVRALKRFYRKPRVFLFVLFMRIRNFFRILCIHVGIMKAKKI